MTSIFLEWRLVVLNLLFELTRICVLFELYLGPIRSITDTTLNDSVEMDNFPLVSNEPVAIVNIHLESWGRGRRGWPAKNDRSAEIATWRI